MEWNCCAYNNKEEAEKIQKELTAFEDWRWQRNPNWKPYTDAPKYPNREIDKIPKGKQHLSKYYFDGKFYTRDKCYFDVVEIELY